MFKNPFKRNEPSCLHIWGEVVDGYQYCSKCSLARIVGCIHEWEIESHKELTRGKDTGIVGEEYIFKCKRCTQRKYVRTSLTGEPIVKMI